MKKVFLAITAILITISLHAQNKPGQQTARGDYRFMFYNCENFFDTEDDPAKRDDEFTPEGMKHWTPRRYQEKLSHIAKVITAVGGWEPPEIVGLCEVENRSVLDDLTRKSPLKVFGYKIIHYESPDSRGIDVALLYIPQKFKPIKSRPIPVVFPEGMGKKTRDILYVEGVLTKCNDTIHIFVNHWPSRWGGQMETDPKRIFVAQLLRTKVDSILQQNPRANIFIMGDLNDFPTDRSLLEGLRAKHTYDNPQPTELYNLSYYLQETKGEFSHRHQGEGGILDQMIVSGNMLDRKGKIYTDKDFAHIYKSEFLLEKDPNYPGYKPFRTYIGYKYHGGFSDHLPPYIDIFCNKN